VHEVVQLVIQVIREDVLGSYIEHTPDSVTQHALCHPTECVLQGLSEGSSERALQDGFESMLCLTQQSTSNIAPVDTASVLELRARPNQVGTQYRSGTTNSVCLRPYRRHTEPRPWPGALCL
jgi:hypothetical protein